MSEPLELEEITLRDIEIQIVKARRAIADLREAGLRLLAEAGVPGMVAHRWLIEHGATESQARELILKVVHERRQAHERSAG